MDTGARRFTAHKVTKSWTHKHLFISLSQLEQILDNLVFLDGSVVKNLPDNAGNMGSIPDPGRSHMPQSDKACAPQLLSFCSRDLTEAKKIKKKWQESTEELYKKGLNDTDNHDGVVTHLESDISECEVKWALESITVNKASEGDGISAQL